MGKMNKNKPFWDLNLNSVTMWEPQKDLFKRISGIKKLVKPESRIVYTQKALR